jgi:hypothetical protein
MMKINFLNVAFAATVIVGNVIVSVSGQPLDPIQVNAFDPDSFGPSNCGLVLGAQETYDAPGWVFCISAICADQPTNDVNKYNGKPFVECQCWQQEVDDPTTDRSILPPAEFGGANCALDSGPGGAAMCDAIKGGALISTYGPRGATRDSGVNFQNCHRRPPKQTHTYLTCHSSLLFHCLFLCLYLSFLLS